MSIVAMDSFFIIMILHATTQFVILGDKMKSQLAYPENATVYSENINNVQKFGNIKHLINEYEANAR